MNKHISVLWVDDDDRNEDAKNLRSELLSVDYVHPGNIEEKLQEYESDETTPDLFLIDFFLSLKPDKRGEKYKYHGLEPNAMIRDKYPEYPIYLVTGETENGDAKLQKWAQAAECVFDKILALEKVKREGKHILYFDALDFRTIRTATRNDIQALYELLRAPESEAEKIKLVLPDDLRTGLSSAEDTNAEGNTISFARWVFSPLLDVPGLLYNRLYAATLLGVNDKGFDRISGEFAEASYTGVFSNTTEPMWWVSTINDILFSKEEAQKIESSDTWLVSSTIFSIPDEEKSKCIVCNDVFPETVGTNKENPKEIGPVHFRCSKPDLNKKRLLYFDGPRMFTRP